MSGQRLLITGASGQLGSALLAYPWPSSWEVFGTKRADLDLADTSSIFGTVVDLQPTVVVNAAAYTAVDAAEDNQASATLVNDAAVAELVRAAEDLDARIVHVSTDYVFDGEKSTPYAEDDPTSPVTAYGRTKLAGEGHVGRYSRGVTLRTAWVYSATGSNFVKTMLRLAHERDTIGVVNDQIGSPTSAEDLAAGVAELVTANNDVPKRLYHLASPTTTTWYDFARAVLEPEIANGTVEVKPLTTDEFPTVASRPKNSQLDCSAIKSDLGIELQPWSEALVKVRREIEQQGRT